MPSATTARRPAAAPAPTSPEQLGAATVALLVAIEGAPAGSPAATAYRSALRRKGQDLAAAGGPAALVDMLARVRTADAACADAREAIVDEAWAGLPGWRH